MNPIEALFSMGVELRETPSFGSAEADPKTARLKTAAGIAAQYALVLNQLRAIGYRVEEVEGVEVEPGAYGMTDFDKRTVKIPNFSPVLNSINPSYRSGYSVVAGMLQNYLAEHELLEAAYRPETDEEDAENEAEHIRLNPFGIMVHYALSRKGNAFSQAVADVYRSEYGVDIGGEYRAAQKKLGRGYIDTVTGMVEELMMLRKFKSGGV